MTPFKIGQFVLMDTMIGVSRPARVEAISPGRRARLIMLDTGERLEDVALGNIAVPGEDAERIQSERSRDSWRYCEGGITNRMGGEVKRPAPNPDYVGIGSTEEGRH